MDDFYKDSELEKMLWKQTVRRRRNMTVLAIAIKGGDFVREGEIVKIEYVEKIEDNYTGYLVTTDEHINKRFAKGNWRLEII